MEARFRIRAQDGQVLEPRTMEIFAELVRSGVVRPEDEIYDSLTGTWVAAGRHPMVALFQDPLVTHPSAAGVSRRPAVEDAADAGGARASDPGRDERAEGDPLPLDLVSVSEPSPEEAQRVFIEKMEEERRQDPELSVELPLLEGKYPSEAQAAPEPEPAPAPAVVEREERRGDAGGVPPDVEIPLVIGPRSHDRVSPLNASRRRWRKAGAVALVLLLPVVVVGMSMRLSTPARGSGEAEVVAADGRAAPAPRPVPLTEEQVRDEAYAVFLEGVEAIGVELTVGEVPEAWLEGFYLADPEGHPEVREFWEGFLDWVERADEREVTLYREAYLNAAARAGLSGPVRSLRMASAAGDFEASRPERAAHYARVRELSRAALALDDLMVALRGRITYEPMRGRRVSADPVLEAAGTDPRAQALLEAALDRVLLALNGPNGAGVSDRREIPDWLVEGLGGPGPGEVHLPPNAP